jgi:hypothetical protein
MGRRAIGVQVIRIGRAGVVGKGRALSAEQSEGLVMVEDYLGGLAEAVWWEMLRQSSDPKCPDQIEEAVRLGAPASLAEQIRRIRAAASASITMPAPDAVETGPAEGATSSPDRGAPRRAKQADGSAEPVGAHGDALAGAPPPKPAAAVSRRDRYRAEWQAAQPAKKFRLMHNLALGRRLRSRLRLRGREGPKGRLGMMRLRGRIRTGRDRWSGTGCGLRGMRWSG